MIQAGIGFAADLDPGDAAERAVEAALVAGGMERADGALVLASAAWGRDVERLLDVAVGSLGTSCVAGASAYGVMGAGQEVAQAPALVVLAFAGLEVEPFLLAELRGEEGRAGAEVAGRACLRDEDLVVFLPDGCLLARPLLDGVRSHVNPATVVGFASAEVSHGAGLSWARREIVTGGVAGMILRPPRCARIGVANAFRSVGEPYTVTRARGNWVTGLDGRPALEVYREVARGPLASDLRRAAQHLLLAEVRRSEEPGAEPALIARNVVGFDEERGAISIPHPLEPGDEVALVLRDGAAAREELARALRDLGPAEPGLGLYFGCRAFGAALLGYEGLESGYLDGAFPGAAIAGAQGAYQIGPPAPGLRGGGEELLTYTGVLALVDG